MDCGFASRKPVHSCHWLAGVVIEITMEGRRSTVVLYLVRVILIAAHLRPKLFDLLHRGPGWTTLFKGPVGLRLERLTS
jgi:hypothetical protein